jgi:magnesium transporter
MSHRKKKRKTGLPSGSLIYTGDIIVENPDVTVVQYNESIFQQSLLKGVECKPIAEDKVSWYDMRGLTNVTLVEHIGKFFNIHPLALEDILNTTQRPKWEDYPNGIFVIVRALRFDVDNQDVIHEQIAIFLRKNLVLTFQEDAEDLFKIIRERLMKTQGVIRYKGADYLVYALLDLLVDQYFEILDQVDDKLEKLETQILTNFTPSVRNRIYHYKRLVSEIRRVILPLRDVIIHFSREETKLVETADNFYFRDLHDHLSRVVEMLDNQRDTLNNLNDLYHAEQSNRANYVMKLLTIVSAIFIPLTFIVGVYGTNFDVLPELHHPKGYFYMWVVMGSIAVLQLIYFRWKKWL